VTAGFRRRAAFAAALALPLWFAGCASVRPMAGGSPPMSGRLLVKVAAVGEQPAQSHTASFELSGTEQAGEMKLLGPLGAQVALARWGADGASLQDAQGTRQFADLPSLAAEALGEPLPLGALLHWLQGRPWPGAPHRDGAQGFSQLGWSVDLARWNADALIEATRVDPPGVSVRAKLDRHP
jgi:outer membrane lipoprotein LolB